MHPTEQLIVTMMAAERQDKEYGKHAIEVGLDPFGGDNEAALEHLDNAGADVIVSDTQMSGVDGLALLQPVRMRHPETARIMLTG